MSVMNEHALREKGGGFVAGGDIPDNIRTTAWQFMGQEIPANFGKLVFGTPLVKKADFDPAAESSHGLLSASTEKREESEQVDQPMENPFEQLSRHTGSSQNREEPVNQWEQQCSSPGSPEPQDDAGQHVAPPQGLKVMKNKMMHLLKNKMIQWVKRSLIFGKQKIEED